MTHWVRLWEDMPTDPKWRIIAKRSWRPTSEVIALFTMMMTNAGSANPRGSLSSWDDEAAAMVLDMDEAHVAAIREAMQGRILDGDALLGWEKIKGPSKLSRPPFYEWVELREFVFRRDNFQCVYCDAKGGRLECDHITPVSRGGDHEPDNLVTACFSCNRSKGSKTLEEWRQ